MSTYLIITCSIDNTGGSVWPDKRRQEYYLGIANILNLCPKTIKPIIVENSKDNESYLDVFSCDILYTNDNSRIIVDDKILHKGQREIIDIRKVIEKYNIQDNDTVIKVTGRYLLFKDDFFKTVLENTDKDAVFRDMNVCTYETGCNHMVLGLFALKCKHFKKFNYYRYSIGAEEDFRLYINQNIEPEKILIVKKLWLRMCLSNTNKMVDT